MLELLDESDRAGVSETFIARPDVCDSHFFHADCLREWTSRDSSCPLCRTRLREVAVYKGDGELAEVKSVPTIYLADLLEAEELAEEGSSESDSEKDVEVGTGNEAENEVESDAEIARRRRRRRRRRSRNTISEGIETFNEGENITVGSEGPDGDEGALFPVKDAAQERAARLAENRRKLLRVDARIDRERSRIRERLTIERRRRIAEQKSILARIGPEEIKNLILKNLQRLPYQFVPAPDAATLLLPPAVHSAAAASSEATFATETAALGPQVTSGDPARVGEVNLKGLPNGNSITTSSNLSGGDTRLLGDPTTSTLPHQSRDPSQKTSTRSMASALFAAKAISSEKGLVLHRSDDNIRPIAIPKIERKKFAGTSRFAALALKVPEYQPDFLTGSNPPSALATPATAEVAPPVTHREVVTHSDAEDQEASLLVPTASPVAAAATPELTSLAPDATKTVEQNPLTATQREVSLPVDEQANSAAAAGTDGSVEGVSEAVVGPGTSSDPVEKSASPEKSLVQT